MEKTMCRIDELFNVSSLDEKTDPIERFEQALDEYKAEGKFRDLLIKHFSDDWENVFRGISKFEEALSKIEVSYSEAEKCIAFLLSQRSTLEFSFISFINKAPVRKTALLDFLDDVKQSYYQDSPFDFYTSGMDKIAGNYYLFVSWLYGRDYCFTQGFFDDKSLNSLSADERTDELWNVFYSVAHQLRSLDKNCLLKELTSIASSEHTSGPLTKNSHEILRGFEFIRVWIKFDSQAGRLSYNWFDLLEGFYSPWENIENLVNSKVLEFDEKSVLLRKWLEDKRREFEKVLYVSADLTQASVENEEKWARGLDGYFASYINNYIYCDFGQLTSEELDERLSDALKGLCSQLTPQQIKAWIKWSVKRDFQRVISSKENSTSFSNSTDKWIQKEYFDPWKGIFLESLNELEVEDQLSILSCSLPYTKECYLGYFDWWNELFNHLVKNDNFPKILTPYWTVSAIGKSALDRDALLPYIDKSIGILRGELSKTGSTEEEINKYHHQLGVLLTILDSSSTVKALRHRLLLMRSSVVPFSDETVSKMGGLLNRENFSKWYDSLTYLADSQLASLINGNRAVTTENHSKIKSDFYIAFSHELAEFCLSRLRLRKGEKAKDGEYEPSQVIEQSSVWRQGYLKALTELGFDLKGKVHKTVNFTKKSDPDESVRAIASECYKAVRRSSKKKPSIQDLKRGIVAAEWWLLISQRRELKLEINPEDALKTRRNLMRNP
jgi:hypothetical protein